MADKLRNPKGRFVPHPKKRSSYIIYNDMLRNDTERKMKMNGYADNLAMIMAERSKRRPANWLVNALAHEKKAVSQAVLCGVVRLILLYEALVWSQYAGYEV